jgi:hypothetical protein
VSNSSNPSIAQDFKAGDKLAACYTLKEMLPPQGFCVVWLVHDEELNRDIELHFVPDSVVADTRAVAELKQECKRNRQLIHPRIVRVHDLIEEEKWAAISMDHVQGETLAALQKKHEKNAFNPAELSNGIGELCQTLEDAHRIDLFHRDLTPENLILGGTGLMVQKFGISRVILDSLARGGRQMEGGRDIAYISPQQLDGERPSRGDDVYSMGATLYDLLTGAPPFEGDLIPQIRKTVPQPVSERRGARGIGGEPVSKTWDDAIAACLAKTPEERPKTAAEAATRFGIGKPASAAAAGAAVAAGAAAAAGVEKPAERAADAAGKSGATPVEKESAGKPQKRPWFSGPAKTPLVTEATVISKTAVPKGDAKGDSKPQPPKETTKPADQTSGAPRKTGGPTTPTGFPLRAFVEVEGDSKAQKSKSPAGLVIAGVVLAIVIIGYIIANKGASNNSPVNGSGGAVATTSSNAEVQTTAGQPAATDQAAAGASPSAAPVNVADNTAAAGNGSAPADTMAQATPPAEQAAASTSPPIPVAVAVVESPAPAAAMASPIPLTGLASMTDAQAQQMAADKARAIDQAKAALADAEKAAAEKAAAATAAAATIKDAQAAIKAKADAADAAKKAAADAAATLKTQQDLFTKAQADADAAQKAAADKAQTAAQLQKTVQDAQAAIQQQTAAQKQAEADAASATQAAADRQKAADDAAKAAAAAEQTRQQQAQALAQAQSDFAALQSRVQQAQQAAAQAAAQEKARKAAEDAAKLQQERAAQAQQLAAQAAAAAKAAADAEKALEVAKKAVADAEKAQHDAEAQAEAARNATLAMPTPGIAPETTPAATPSATPPGGAAATPAVNPGAPTLSVQALNPHLKVDQALTNSLGMRFAPVGNVFFAVWLTRVQDFQAFADATGYKGNAWREPGFKQAPDHPVVNVSWNDANQFCLWLTGKEHHDGILAANETYRLPTDLEWSNAVGLPPESGRTPESRDMDVPDVYPWGTEWPPPAGAGNYTGEETDSDVAIKGYNDGFAWTSPVGSFTPNKFGLFDMGGNVWEWCADWWNSEQKQKVLRGGSWYNGALKLSLLSSCRIHYSADQTTDNYGFRIVLAQESTKAKHK